MSSPPIFKAPFPIPKSLTMVHIPLISEKEVEGLRGKFRALARIFKRPRRHLPELQIYITQLFQCQNTMLHAASFPYTVENRCFVNHGIETMKLLKDLIIRVIVKGEDTKEVWESQMAHLIKMETIVHTRPPPHLAPQ